MHVSTAFVHGRNAGSPASPLPQHLPDLGGRDPAKLYRSAQNAASKNGGNPKAGGGGKDAINAIRELGYPNTYTFTKAIGEHLLARAVRAHNRRCEEQERRVALDRQSSHTPKVFRAMVTTLLKGLVRSARLPPSVAAATKMRSLAVVAGGGGGRGGGEHAA